MTAAGITVWQSSADFGATRSQRGSISLKAEPQSFLLSSNVMAAKPFRIPTGEGGIACFASPASRGMRYTCPVRVCDGLLLRHKAVNRFSGDGFFSNFPMLTAVMMGQFRIREMLPLAGEYIFSAIVCCSEASYDIPRAEAGGDLLLGQQT